MQASVFKYAGPRVKKIPGQLEIAEEQFGKLSRFFYYKSSRQKKLFTALALTGLGHRTGKCSHH